MRQATQPLSSVTAITSATEPEVTERELLARARALRPRLIAEQAATETRTTYSPDMHAEFVNAGFYRLYVPRRFGGLELTYKTFARMVIEVARGCPSSAWCLGLSTSHTLQAASYWGEAAQVELFGQGGHFAMASSAQPIGMAKRVDGGWELNGKASYCSGIPYASHYLAHALIPPQQPGPPASMMCIVPKKDYTIVEDWGALVGLKGSGSNSVTIKDAFMPSHFGLEGAMLLDMDVSEGTPGYRLHNNPLYIGRGLTTFMGTLTAVVVGAAYNALDEYERKLDGKVNVPPFHLRRDDADYQRWFGSAVAKIAAAEAALLGAADQHQEACENLAREGKNYTYLEDARGAAIAREVMLQCWDVMHDLWRTAGSSSGVTGSRMDRLLRDMSTAVSHRSMLLRDFFHRELAQSHLHAGGKRPTVHNLASRPI